MLAAALATTSIAAAADTKPAAGAHTPPAKKAPAKPTSKTSSAKSSSKTTRTSDAATRRLVAGGPTEDDVAASVDSPELRALSEAEQELFPPATPALGAPWPTELPSPLSAPEDTPRVHATGLPPTPPPSSPPIAEGGNDLAWLSQLQMPDLPVRWDARVVRYLEFFKDDPRGRQVLGIWTRRSGRYRELVRRTLRKKGLPEDLVWLAMIESSFDPTARSVAGAMGLWQFMPETARAYGLSIDRWADQRLNPEAATEAAAEFLGDLHRRFGSWELAMAAYNMGYWGVAGSVRKYNTNDFWVLSRLEAALPWETTLYVPKILAAAIVGAEPARLRARGSRRRAAARRRAGRGAAGDVARGRRAGGRVRDEGARAAQPRAARLAHPPSAAQGDGARAGAAARDGGSGSERLSSEGAGGARARWPCRRWRSSGRGSRRCSGTSSGSASRSSRSPPRSGCRWRSWSS